MKKSLRSLPLLWLLWLPAPSLWAQVPDYRKATEGRDVVMDKLYPKNQRFELGLGGGFVMNQSYVNTVLFGPSGTYYISENMGFSLEFDMTMNKDKQERTCIESFYYDPSNEVGSACGDASLITADGVDANKDQFPRYGPAYVPIRELKSIMLANFVWSPVYGKQLLFLSATSYFDLFFELGLGLASSTYYPKQAVLKNGNEPRGIYQDPNNPANDKQQANVNNAKIGALAEDSQYYGVEGRPDPVANNNVLVNLGVGQKFHFGKLFHLKIYVRNMTLLGTEDAFENLLSIYGGAGIRF